MYVGADAVWRGLSAEGWADFEAVAATDAYRRAQDEGTVVATTVVPDDERPAEEGWSAWLRHRRVPVVTYPYEWPFSMLRRAALLQLELGRAMLADGVLVKDATPYNVQFEGIRPVFIDVGSFAPIRPGEPWAGYRQFCQLFLNPLVMQAVVGVPYHPWLRGSLDGIPPGVAAAVLGRRKRLRRDLFAHVRFHARAEARYADDADRDVRGELRQAGFGPKIVDAQMASLERAVRRLDWRASSSEWSAYGERSHYTDDDLRAKEDFVSRVVRSRRPSTVLDLGANDGRFSRAALAAGASAVVAVDSDHLVVDHLYRDLEATGERRILPLVMDLADPSPSIGWRNRERPSFVERVRPDLVLCLAVIHHLALTNTVPLDGIVAFLGDFGAPLVVEMPHRDDPMVRRLLRRKRDGLFDHYDRPQWEAALARAFRVVDRLALPGGTRTLYHCEPL